jgi:hypothetical protein
VSGAATEREAIGQVLAEFCVGVDRLDYELIESCFHADAEVDFGGFVSGPVAGYFDFVRGPDGLGSFERTMHNLGTTTVEIDGDVAHSQAYCVAYHSGGEDHPWCKGFVVVHARYLDRLEKRDGRWAIARRVCAFEWGQNQTTGEAMELPAENLGRRDRTDLAYTR